MILSNKSKILFILSILLSNSFFAIHSRFFDDPFATTVTGAAIGGIAGGGRGAGIGAAVGLGAGLLGQASSREPRTRRVYYAQQPTANSTTSYQPSLSELRQERRDIEHEIEKIKDEQKELEKVKHTITKEQYTSTLVVLEKRLKRLLNDLDDIENEIRNIR